MRQSVSIVVGPRERRAPLADLVRSHEEAFLDPPGCPVCEYCVEAEEQFFRWFEIESFADPKMHARLRRSVGFCPRHERRALRVRQLAPIPAIVRGALEQLGSEPPERGECPACASVRQAREHAEGMLHTVLGSPDLSARYAERDVGAAYRMWPSRSSTAITSSRGRSPRSCAAISRPATLSSSWPAVIVTRPCAPLRAPRCPRAS